MRPHTGVTLRPYDIRHIAATEMLARGADLAAVAAQLGHSNVATTGGSYAHVTAGSQTRAAALMLVTSRIFRTIKWLNRLDSSLSRVR